jgi:SAM-dependent methyltransferase
MSDALERFEQLVLSQKPASVPWEPVTDYSYEARREAEGPHAQIIMDVFQPSYVLDVGCGPGHLVAMLRMLGGLAEGIDVSATPEMERRGIWRGDIVGQHPCFHADVVICREVLEHLTVRHVRKAVTNLCALSSRYCYVTTRFHPNPADLLDVATSDDLDPTHITMLNQTLLRALFVLEGFRRRADLEQRLDWKHLGRVLVYERAD